MGQIFHNLTQPGTALQDPGTGQTTAIGNPNQILGATQPALESAFTPDMSGVLSGTPKPQQIGPLPSIGKPSFSEAASAGALPGSVNPLSPGLNKAGKLAVLLTSGLQGALAGHAAQEQAILESGGRRAGGAGLAFQQAYMLPWQRAMAPLQYQQAEAQTQLARAGLQPINTPFGTMPAELAMKSVLPWLIRGQAMEGAAGIRAGATTGAAQTRAEASRDVARINQGMGIPVDQTTAHLAGFPELAGQMAGRGTWTNINKALEARGYRVQDMGQNGTSPNEGMWLMDRAGNRIQQVSPNSLVFQRGASFAQNRPEVVVDPNDPGYAYYTTAAKAMQRNLPAPEGAPTQAARTEARSEVPRNIGDLKVAFKTAIQHADMLRQAASALQNGNTNILNRLKNGFDNAFGASGPITAKAIADAYNREVTSVVSKGHMTNEEIASIGQTLDPMRQSPQQMSSVLDAYQGLMRSKLNMLNQQAGAAARGKATPSVPNRPKNVPSNYNFNPQNRHWEPPK